MNILVCDEKSEFIEEWLGRIEKYISKEKHLRLETFTSIRDAKRMIREVSFDIAFIDAEINGESGIDLARYLYLKNNQCLVVFVSDHREYITMAFKIRAFQFLFKDVSDDDLKEEMEYILQSYKIQKAKCVFYTNGQVKTFFPKEIMYIETRNRKIKIMTTIGSFYGEVDNLPKLKTNLQDFGFYQIHQSYFLNLNFILSMRKGEVELKNGEVLPTSILNRKQIKEKMEEFLLLP